MKVFNVSPSKKERFERFSATHSADIGGRERIFDDQNSSGYPVFVVAECGSQ